MTEDEVYHELVEAAIKIGHKAVPFSLLWAHSSFCTLGPPCPFIAPPRQQAAFVCCRLFLHSLCTYCTWPPCTPAPGAACFSVVLEPVLWEVLRFDTTARPFPSVQRACCVGREQWRYLAPPPPPLNPLKPYTLPRSLRCTRVKSGWHRTAARFPRLQERLVFVFLEFFQPLLLWLTPKFSSNKSSPSR